jgi:hypothetical protein
LNIRTHFHCARHGGTRARVLALRGKTSDRRWQRPQQTGASISLALVYHPVASVFAIQVNVGRVSGTRLSRDKAGLCEHGQELPSPQQLDGQRQVFQLGTAAAIVRRLTGWSLPSAPSLEGPAASVQLSPIHFLRFVT